MDRSTRRSVLLLAEDELGPRMRGPGARALGLARGLARRHPVTVAARGGAGAAAGLRVVPATRARLLREAVVHDVVVAPWVPPFLLLACRLLGRWTIADLYDRADIELEHLDGDDDGERESIVASTDLQLRHADVVLCAGHAQAAYLRERAALLGTAVDPVVVPPAVPAVEGAIRARGLRQRVPEVADADPLVVWWGSVWAWFDAATAVLAVERLRAAHPQAALVICAGLPGGQDVERFSSLSEVRALAAERGLLGRGVFILDEWIPAEERFVLLADADVAVSLHRGGAEARHAARARLLDHLAARLPSVLTRGDELSSELAEAGAARLVDVGDVRGVAAALRDWAEDRDARAAAGAAASALAGRRTWHAAVTPLINRLAAPPPARSPVGRVARDVASYYRLRAARLAGRAIQRVVERTTRPARSARSCRR